nr:uncharacterized protein LOC111502134 [Leptinotarsa decemlineata]
MTGIVKWVLLLTVSTIHAQDPRRRIFNQILYPLDELQLSKTDDEDVPCPDRNCLPKRSVQEENNGPFWANRGKKDPTYMRESLFAEEPYYVLVRKDDRFSEEPFFVSRGKKESKHRDRREFPEDVDSPFFAARGKRPKSKN